MFSWAIGKDRIIHSWTGNRWVICQSSESAENHLNHFVVYEKVFAVVTPELLISYLSDGIL